MENDKEHEGLNQTGDRVNEILYDQIKVNDSIVRILYRQWNEMMILVFTRFLVKRWFLLETQGQGQRHNYINTEKD